MKQHILFVLLFFSAVSAEADLLFPPEPVDSVLYCADENSPTHQGSYNISENAMVLLMISATKPSDNKRSPDTRVACETEFTEVVRCRLFKSKTMEDMSIGEHLNLSESSSDSLPFPVYLEGGLALLGLVSNNSDEINQYGYNVEDGYESDAAFVRLGAGYQFENFGIFAYGDYTKFFHGFLFSQRSPASQPILHFHTSLGGFGLEARLAELRFRVGYGKYWGSIEVGEEDPNSTESWSTEIDKGSGLNWSVGILGLLENGVMLGLELTHHGYDIKPHETQTQATASEFHISQWELGMSVVIDLASISQ